MKNKQLRMIIKKTDTIELKIRFMKELNTIQPDWYIQL